MTPLLAATLTTLSIGMLACTSPGGVIRPVIYPDDDQAAAAMRSAPLILMVRIAGVKMTGDMKSVARPQDAGDPTAATIPLHLARIHADVLLTAQGQARTTAEFYSWIWVSGKHGGSRLFHPTPGGIRVVFLRDEGGYLHTVGDYPSYDREFLSDWVPAILSAWKSGHYSDVDPLDRLIALRFRAEFEGLSDRQLREDYGDEGPRVHHRRPFDLADLVGVAGPFFVANQLDDICRHSPNPSARFAACFETGQRFPGRCEAFRLARKATTDKFGDNFLSRRLGTCEAEDRWLTHDLSAGAPLPGFWRWNLTPPYRRETMRVYASAFDPEVHAAACEAAAKMPEARDIPECSAPRDH